MKKKLLLIALLSVAYIMICGFKREDNVGQLWYDVTEWMTVEMWNEGLCDFSHYRYDGKDSCGETIDINFSLERFKANVLKFAIYDEKIKALPDEYILVKQDWELYKNELAKLYFEISQMQTIPVDGGSFDLGLYEQYEHAFKKDFRALKE